MRTWNRRPANRHATHDTLTLTMTADPLWSRCENCTPFRRKYPDTTQTHYRVYRANQMDSQCNCRPYSDVQGGPRHMEKSLAAMHQARLCHPATLIYGSRDEQVGLFARVEVRLRKFVERLSTALQSVLAQHHLMELFEGAVRSVPRLCCSPSVEKYQLFVCLRKYGFGCRGMT